MEQPFKRRRVLRRDDQSKENAISGDNHGTGWASYKLVEENEVGKHLPLYKGSPIMVRNSFNRPLNKPVPSRKASRQEDIRPPKLRPRNYSTRLPQTSTVRSVVQVVVDAGGATLTQALVPAASSIVSFEGIGRLTVNHDPVIPSPSPSSQSSIPIRQPTSSQRSKLVKAASTAISKNSSTSQPSTTIDVRLPSSQKIFSPEPSRSPHSSPSSLSDSSIVSLFAASSTVPFHRMNVGSQQQTVEIIIPFPSASNRIMPFTPLSSAFTTTLSEHEKSKPDQAPTTTPSSSNTRPSTAPTSFSNSTSSSSRFSKLSSSTRKTSISASLSTSTSSHQSSSVTSSTLANPTASPGNPSGGGGGEPGSGTTSVNGTSPLPTVASGPGPGSGGTSSTPAVAGGVVGGVAGLALIILLAVYFLRRRRRYRRGQERGLPPSGSPTISPDSGTLGGTTTERSSAVPLTAGGFFKRLRPHSGHTAATTETGPSERGFQNFGGRKLESVLSSRGDGYSDPGPSSSAGAAQSPGIGPTPSRGPILGHSPGPSGQESLSGATFYRDSQGFYGGKEAEPGSVHSSYVGPGLAQNLSPTFSPQDPASPPPGGAVGSDQRDSGVAVMRPSPARTPVTNQPGFAPLREPPPPPRNMPPLRPMTMAEPAQMLQQDQLGRSHPSFDGSRGSRFTEEV